MGTGPSQTAVWFLTFEPKMQVSKVVPQSKTANNAILDCLHGTISRLAPLKLDH